MLSRIGVVLVTYNRLAKLEVALDRFDKQTLHPAYVLVVNNASTDGTDIFLKDWESSPRTYQKHVITSSVNSGGSGGFYTGLEAALKLDVDWVWLSDDDAFAEYDAIENAERYLQNKADAWDSISAICGQVINQGQIDQCHRRNIEQKGLRIAEREIPASFYARESFELNGFSYVGCIINKKKLFDVGLTNKDYFLWYDDTEHSVRLSKVGKIICVPSVKIHHDVGKVSIGINWKMYYGSRNRADLYRKHFPAACFWYFVGEQVLRSYLRDLLGRKKEYNEMVRAAIKDCINNNFGVHEIYKPGWMSKS